MLHLSVSLEVTQLSIDVTLDHTLCTELVLFHDHPFIFYQGIRLQNCWYCEESFSDIPHLHEEFARLIKNDVSDRLCTASWFSPAS